jgi:hypothetical protein
VDMGRNNYYTILVRKPLEKQPFGIPWNGID